MLPVVHSGQLGQPNPEPVNRTRPPLTTIPTSAARFSSRTLRPIGPIGPTEPVGCSATPIGTIARRPAPQVHPRPPSRALLPKQRCPRSWRLGATRQPPLLGAALPTDARLTGAWTAGR